MTPIERAARAAHVEHNDNQIAITQAGDPTWDGWKSWLPVIRAVSAAIREPSEAMKKAGLAACGGDGSVLDGYEAMIDAMLEEGDGVEASR